MTADIHVGDVGTIFTVTIKDEDAVVVDISTATTKQILLRKPDDSVLTKSASLVTTGTDGKMLYVIVSGDLDQAGDWQLQGYIVLTGGDAWHTDTYDFEVLANL